MSMEYLAGEILCKPAVDTTMNFSLLMAQELLFYVFISNSQDL